MASDPGFVQYVCDQMGEAGEVSHRRMFGEAVIYCQGKVIGLVCDNQVFLKPTAAGRTLLGDAIEASPYPGARAHWLLTEVLEDRQALGALVRATAEELPLPKPRAKKRR